MTRRRGRHPAPRARKDLPLRASVVRDVLTIEIGVDVLAFSALASPFAWKLLQEAVGELTTNRPDDRYRIDDVHGFAKDNVRELLREEEDGSSPLTNLFDLVAQKAIEDGSEFFISPEDDR